jgi:hypothetical protein
LGIIYDIPEGFGVGSYTYVINFTDTYGNFRTDDVVFTVQDTSMPELVSTPSDFTVDYGYTGQSLSWTATDFNADDYSIELQGVGIVEGPSSWSSGSPVIYNIPNGLGLGTYTYTVNFTDDYDHFITDSVQFTVEDTTDPVITFSSDDITIEVGYNNLNISWTATDIFPGTYTIEMVGSGIVIGPLTWTSGKPIVYDIPDGLATGTYVFDITIIDESGNTATATITVTVTVSGGTSNGTIPFGGSFVLISIATIIGLVVLRKRRIRRG